MWTIYKNGNYEVLLNLNNGTKIRYNEEDTLIPSRPESMDVKITNKCGHGCLFCHENSIPSGEEASYDILSDFASKVLPFTEIACGGGSLMEDPNHTKFFLEELQKANAIPSITLQQEDFLNNIELLQDWNEKRLIYGIGVSVDDPDDLRLHKFLPMFPNAVIHTIAGLYDEQYFKSLYDKSYKILKILILGFKRFRRGNKYYMAKNNQIQKNMEWLSDNILDFSNHFKVVSFDNLAIEQLDMQNKLTPQQWSKYYCGDDGNYTFYVDLVEQVFAKNSTSIARFPINDKTPVEMFENIRSLYD